ncbi:PKD domain-containing protein [Myxococcus sp. K15C18031901]|uniref:PKD domain-containing protein n=1 Tax=Myxococcus dinghuensis TaxID=2906761 RepID=UPI0020A6E829|nr:PKD domain-containing protein [Myxococcus dinghuensis]MCP3098817.1 PKD domain-containing protein [Myxococcus dinghuensis]
MRALKTLTVVASLVALVAGCGSESPSTGAVQVVIGNQEFAASEASVTRIQVVVSGADFADISQDLVKTDGVWGGTLADIPSGTQRSFRLTAFASDNSHQYEGQASGVTILAGQTALVAVTLHDVSTPQTPTNEVPIIDSVTLSATTVEPNGVIQLNATAHDPEPNDHLSYSWNASSGQLSSTTIANPSWTAPSSPVATVYLTLTVRDQQNGISAVRLTVTVAPPGVAVGGATVQVTFNHPPFVLNVIANEGRVLMGQSTYLSANVVDPDRGEVFYQWTASCPGTFSTPTSMSSVFTPSAVPAAPCNNCLVTMTARDPLGGVRSASTHICVVATALP